METQKTEKEKEEEEDLPEESSQENSPLYLFSQVRSAKAWPMQMEGKKQMLIEHGVDF